MRSLVRPAIDDADEMFKKYIKISDEQNRLLMTDLALLSEIKRRFYESHQEVEKGKLDSVWNFMFPMMQKNEALAQFVLDKGGAESDFFFPWVMSVARSPSEALELSYNEGRNLSGEWISRIPEDDNINFFVRTLPTLAYNRRRQKKVASLVTDDKWALGGNGKSIVVDLGAGRMAWARHHGFEPDPVAQRIYACDKDPTIDVDKLFPNGEFGKDGLVYERKDIMDELRNPSCAEASLVILQGVASYYPAPVFTRTIMKPVHALLREGGSFFFDLQLNHISYEWSVKVFGWPEMKLPESATMAMDMVEAMRLELWNDGMKSKMKYINIHDTSPLSLMVLMTKT